jgi:hypothetical protein
VVLDEVVTDLPRSRLLGLKALLLDVAVNSIEFMEEGRRAPPVANGGWPCGRVCMSNVGTGTFFPG